MIYLVDLCSSPGPHIDSIALSFSLSFGPLCVDSIYDEKFREGLQSVPGGVLRQVRRSGRLCQEVGPDDVGKCLSKSMPRR